MSGRRRPPTRLRSSFVLSAAVLTLASCQGTSPVFETLQPCTLADGPPDAYCGRLQVFEDRAAKRGRTIDLKIVVAPALRRDAKPDPLFVFEGGPGGGAATLAQYRIPMFRRFQTDRDIVLIDQRGTGESNPLDCSPRSLPQDDDFRSLDEYPVERFRDCLETLDADPRLYTTALAMDDIDDVRRYLGYQSINLWGGSYGTRAALVYLKRHESTVRSVVLDGVAPPDMRLPLYMARDSQRALDRLLDDCAHDAVCARTFPDLRGTVARLWTHLAERPHVAFTHPRTGEPREVTLSPRLVAIVVFQSLYSPEVAALLPRLLDRCGGRQRPGTAGAGIHARHAQGRDERRPVPVRRLRRGPAAHRGRRHRARDRRPLHGEDDVRHADEAVRVLAARRRAGRLLRAGHVGEAGAAVLGRERPGDAAVLGRARREAPGERPSHRRARRRTHHAHARLRAGARVGVSRDGVP